MDSLYLLIPLSLLLVFAVGALFWWALQAKQFDDLEEQGRAILNDDERGEENGSVNHPRP